MARNVLFRVAIAAVLAVVMSAKTVTAVTNACTTDTATCLPGYVFDVAATYEDSGTLCSVENNIKCEGTGHQECCKALKCAGIDSSTYCPYGLKPITTDPGTVLANAVAVHKCCEADPAKHDAFPVCWTTGSAGTTAFQALDNDDTNWGIQDNAGFARSVGQYTAMCFSVTTKHYCADGDDIVRPQCCTTKTPTYLQLKLPTAAGATGSQDAPVAALTTRCKVSYGNELANVRSLKRITRFTAVTASDAEAQYFNVPLTFKKGQKQVTVCIYALNAAPNVVDCSWETICGLSGSDPVLHDGTGYAKGCQLRILGRKVSGSSACCTPTFSVDSFDASEGRLMSAADAAKAGAHMIGLRV